MSKKKNHYYVLVFTSTGPAYVTGIPRRSYAEWDKNKEPYEMTKSMAEEVAYGLNLNGYAAQMVISPFEAHQPYRYENGKFEWHENEG